MFDAHRSGNVWSQVILTHEGGSGEVSKVKSFYF